MTYVGFMVMQDIHCISGVNIAFDIHTSMPPLLYIHSPYSHAVSFFRVELVPWMRYTHFTVYWSRMRSRRATFLNSSDFMLCYRYSHISLINQVVLPHTHIVRQYIFLVIKFVSTTKATSCDTLHGTLLHNKPEELRQGLSRI